MNVARGSLLAAACAAVVYLPALRNGFAYDDGAIIELNPVAHSVGAALRAFGEPYWPPKHPAGLWRPLTILSYATDWQLSGGSAAVMHGTNLVLHATVTGLLVPLFAAYIPVHAAVAAAWLFAVHPVHVEAVANTVGRAELLAALFLIGALLLARRARERGPRRLPFEAAVVGCVTAALLSKEHAVVAVALLALDDLAQRGDGRRLRLGLLIAVAAVTAGWLVVRGQVDQGLSFRAVAPVFFLLDAPGRLATMGPVILELVRLLAWPFDLRADYQPQLIERLEHVTLAGAMGYVALAAAAGLALLAWRRDRAASVGLLLIGIAWSPTSNLLFPSGVALAERALYLPSVGWALVLGSLASRLLAWRGRRVLLVVIAPVLAAWGAKTVTQIPVWGSTRAVVVDGLLRYPESYKVHQAAARVYVRLGDHAAADREYRQSVELYPLDPYNLAEAAEAARTVGRPREALVTLAESEALDSTYSLTQQYYVLALLDLGRLPEALARARQAVGLSPKDAEANRLLAAAFLANGAPDSALGVWPAFERAGGPLFERWLLAATTFAAVGMVDSGWAAWRRAETLLPPDTTDLRRLGEARQVVEGAVSGR